MGTTQPIKNRNELRLFQEYYHHIMPSARNYALVMLGLHTALRISDILNLQWGDVYDFNNQTFRTHLSVREQKTGKENTIALNPQALAALAAYMSSRTCHETNYIFTKTTDFSQPLNRSQAYRIIRRAAEETLHKNHISCHSLRKTFGYHAWKQGTPPALLMDIYNHSSYRITKRYLGIEQDEKDDIFLKIKM